jgi:DNA-binding transcriptional ArsR family regulator
MSGSDGTRSGESRSTQDDVDAAPFSTLSNETRLRIVDTLYEETAAEEMADACSYSTLREAASVDDNGNFNYHLDRLRDRFVEKADDGYRLTFAGFEVAKSLRADAWRDHEVRGPVEVEQSSPVVDGRPLYVTYEDGLVHVHAADEEPVFRIAVRPAGAAVRGAEELVDVMAAMLRDAIESAHRGVCPYCHAPPDRSIESSDTGRWRWQFVADCPECGPLFELPVGAAVVRHPAVVSFYWERGIDVRDRRLWTLELWGDGAVSRVRGQYRIRIEREGTVLELVLDDDATVSEATVERG